MGDTLLDSKRIKQDVYAHSVRVTTYITLARDWDIEFPYVKGMVRLDRIVLEWSPLDSSTRKNISFHGHKIKKNGEPGEVYVERSVWDGKYLDALSPILRAIIAKGFEEAPSIV